jgi:hypothetical protein
MGMSGSEATLVMILLLALSLVAAMGMMFKKTLSETAALMAERSGRYDSAAYRERLQPRWLTPVLVSAWIGIFAMAVGLASAVAIVVAVKLCGLAALAPQGIGVILRPHFAHDLCLDLAHASMLRRKAEAQAAGRDVEVRSYEDAIGALALARKPTDLEPWRRRSFEQ